MPAEIARKHWVDKYVDYYQGDKFFEATNMTPSNERSHQDYNLNMHRRTIKRFCDYPEY